jgi:hypothetical protein
MNSRYAAALPLFVGACAGSGSPGDDPQLEPRAGALLVDMASWVEGDEATAPDPFPSHRPEGTAGDCPAGSVVLEGASLEIRTGTCGYAWLQQPLVADFREGEPIEFVLWHADLVAEGPAEAHLAVVVDEQVLFEGTVPIPSDPVAYTEAFEAPFDAPAGAVATLHLHNHGANVWNFLRLERMSTE